mgnify:CR=1 FL=1
MNDGSEGEIRKRTVDDLIRSFENCNGNYAFLIGAGMSKRAGIDTAYDLIEEWRDECYEHADPDMDNDNWVDLMEKDVTEGGEYGFWFQERYPIYEERRRFIRNLVEGSEPKREHIILASLMKGEDAYVPHILTPNFDDLLYDAFYRYFDERPLLINHNSIVPQFQLTRNRAAIIKLHGDYLYDNLQNLNTEALKENMQEALERTLREYGLIVVGYSGRDESIMGVINDNDFEISGHGVYWCTLNADDLSPKAKELLRKPNTYVVEIDGAKELFDSFFEQMKDEIDPALPDPEEIMSRAESRSKELPEIVSDSDSTEEPNVEEEPDELNEESAEEAEHREDSGGEEEISEERESVSLRMRADFRRYEEDYEGAVELYNKAIELDPEDEQSYQGRGIVHSKMGRIGKAAEDFEQALEYFREAGNRQGEANSLGNLGLVARKRGDLDEAEEYHRRVLEIKRELNDRQGEANSLNNLGSVARKRGDLDEAEKYYKESLEIKRELDDRQGEANSLGNLGLVAKERGDLDEAEEYHRRSLEIKRELDYRQGEAKSLNNLGLVAEERGNLDEAKEYYDEAFKISHDIGAMLMEIEVTENYVEICEEKDEVDEAIEWCDKAIKIAKRLDNEEYIEQFQTRREELGGDEDSE